MTGGNYWDYAYDSIGQLKTALGKESGGTARLHEKLGYAYDAAGNLQYRTNNAMVQTFGVNSLNELTTVTRTNTLTVAGTTSSAATNVTVNSSAATRYGDNSWALAGVSLTDGTNTVTAIAQDSSGRADTNAVTAYLPASATYQYDDNGNLTSDGRRGFEYDNEDRLISITVTNSWRSYFTYDPFHRRRLREEYTWQNSAWVKTEEVRYVYDGNLVIQERDADNLPRVTYTRGPDLSGSLPDGPTGASGIGGLLARTDHNSQPATHSYYQPDGNGNITCLINEKQAVVASYAYNPYGNMLSKSGPMAESNFYRFSSKEAHAPSGLLYYLYRYYEPTLQRWTSADPLRQSGGLNVFLFTRNSPLCLLDPLGLDVLAVELYSGTYTKVNMEASGTVNSVIFGDRYLRWRTVRFERWSYWPDRPLAVKAQLHTVEFFCAPIDLDLMRSDLKGTQTLDVTFARDQLGNLADGRGTLSTTIPGRVPRLTTSLLFGYSYYREQEWKVGSQTFQMDRLSKWSLTYNNTWKVSFTPGDTKAYVITLRLTNESDLARKQVVTVKVDAAHPTFTLAAPGDGGIWAVDPNWTAVLSPTPVEDRDK